MSEIPTDQHQKRRVIRRRLAAPTDSATAGSAGGTVESTAVPEATVADAPEPVLAAADPSSEIGAPRAGSVTAWLRAKKLPRPAWIADAAAIAVALGLGWLGASALSGDDPVPQPSAASLAETADSLRQGQQDVLRLAGDVKALKVAIETLKDSVDRSRTELSTRQSQLSERLDKADRGPQETVTRLAKLAEQLDRVEAAGRAPVQKLTAVDERLERMERQIGHLQTAAAKAPAAAIAPLVAAATAAEPVQTGSLEGKPAHRDTPIEGWVLHDVYNGTALIESRDRRLLEVGLGAPIPGIGRVEGIERRGRRWVVVTPKGLITMER